MPSFKTNSHRRSCCRVFRYRAGRKRAERQRLRLLHNPLPRALSEAAGEFHQSGCLRSKACRARNLLIRNHADLEPFLGEPTSFWHPSTRNNSNDTCAWLMILAQQRRYWVAGNATAISHHTKLLSGFARNRVNVGCATRSWLQHQLTRRRNAYPKE